MTSSSIIHVPTPAPISTSCLAIFGPFAALTRRPGWETKQAELASSDLEEDRGSPLMVAAGIHYGTRVGNGTGERSTTQIEVYHTERQYRCKSYMEEEHYRMPRMGNWDFCGGLTRLLSQQSNPGQCKSILHNSRAPLVPCFFFYRIKLAATALQLDQRGYNVNRINRQLIISDWGIYPPV